MSDMNDSPEQEPRSIDEDQAAELPPAMTLPELVPSTMLSGFLSKRIWWFSSNA
jgi:hypothetical protein